MLTIKIIIGFIILIGVCAIVGAWLVAVFNGEEES